MSKPPFPPVANLDPVVTAAMDEYIDKIVKEFPKLEDRDALLRIICAITDQTVAITKQTIISNAVIAIAHMYEPESLLAPIDEAVLEQTRKDPDKLMKAMASLVQADTLEVLLAIADNRKPPVYKLMPPPKPEEALAAAVSTAEVLAKTLSGKLPN